MTRALVRRAFDAALDAVDARRTTEAWLRAHPIEGAVEVLAIGKAALSMAAGAAAACDVRGGMAIAPLDARGEALPPSIDILRGAHPVPDAEVARRGEAWLARAARVRSDATALVLVSGGGSALADAPVRDITASDLADITRRLLACGASIDELNAVRVALSRSKGGGLARALGRARARTLVVNDIAPHGDPALVASGPMSPWRGPSPLAIIERAHVRAALHDRERELVASWQPSADVDRALEVVADNERAVDAARRVLVDAGRDVGDGPALEGEARLVGRAWTEAARTTPHAALIAGGETTVTVRGDGRGGRNQELALAAWLAGFSGTLLACGTDGIDGPTDAAGAMIDEALGPIDRAAAERALDRNDAYPLLAALGALVVTGPSGTNVADVAIWVR